MNDQLIPISLILLSALYAGVGLLVWGRRPGLAITPFAWTMFSVAVWSLGYGLELMAPSLQGKVFWGKIEYMGAFSVTVFLFFFCAAYTGRSKLLSKRNQILLWVIPVVSLTLAWTNQYHHLIWKTVTVGNFGGLSFLSADFGFWFWLQIVYSYTLVILAAVFLTLEVFRSPRPYNLQAGIILLGALFPWVGSFLYLSGTIFPGIDITPFAFVPTVLLMAWGILRYRLLEILPTAPAMILHALQDGVIVIDARKRVLYLNNIAERLLRTPAEHAIGQPIGSIRATCLETLRRLIEQRESYVEEQLELNGQKRYFDIRVSSISAENWGTNGTDVSHLIIIRDIHDRKQVELNLKRREAMMEALNMASQQFLRSAAWETNIPVFLEHIGQSAEVSRAYVCQNYEGADSQVFTSQCYEWTAPGVAPQIDNPAFRQIPIQEIGPAKWYAELNQERLVTALVRDLPELHRGSFLERGVRSTVIVPIFVKRRWWGILGLEDYLNERQWSKAELDVLQAATEIFSASEVRARNENTLRRRQRTLNLLHEIVASALQTTNRYSMAQTFVNNLGNLVNADACFLSLWDETNEKFTPLAAYGQYSKTYLSLTTEPGETTLTASALAAGHTLIVDDISNTPYLSPRIATLLPFRSVMTLPLITGQEKLGAILLAYENTHHFQPEEISIGEHASGLVALTLEKFYAVEDASRRAEEAEILRKAGAVVASTLHSDEAIDRILEQLSLVVPYDSASVQLLRNNELEIVGGRGWDNPEEILGLRFPIPDDNPNTVVLQTGKPYILGDAIKAHSSFRKDGPHKRIRSWLGVPMIVRGQIIGLLTIDSAQLNYFTENYVKTVTTFADQVAIALENARLFEETQNRLRDQIMLRDASVIISSALDKKTILTRLSEQLCKAINGTSAYINEYNKETEEFTVIAEYISSNACEEEQNSDLGVAYPKSREEDEFVMHMQIGEYDISHVDDPKIPASEREHMQEYGAKSILYVPLNIKEQLIGFAELWESRHKRAFSTEEINLCILLSQQAAIAIENARLFEEVQNLALTDPLTGLYNRRGLFEIGHIEFSRSVRLERPFSAIMLDLDHFKSVNDQYGHPVGDQVLQFLASELHSTVRGTDIVGRYGGEEFVIFLSGSDGKAAVDLAERLRRMIQETPFFVGENEIKITISLGAAEYNENSPNLETLVARADQALYVAKHKGRNQVILGK
jgi:diguanylate cyclase (GGDEF)-like protein/PAS domain S-box-containing protein